jgi:zinc transport system substrate-binding protein
VLHYNITFNGRPTVRKLFFLLLMFSSLPLLAAPRVVVSIAPVHSLVSGVMAGVAEPQLLIPPGASPHAYSLKPSDARALAEAQLVVWVGESLEPMLEKPLAALAGSARVIELAGVEGMQRLNNREGGIWGEGHAGEKHEGHGHGEVDMHLWLAPENARRIVSVVASQLVELDGANAAHYRRNAAVMIKRIDALEAKLKLALAPVHEIPYIIFHDAYHYFEEAFSLSPAGAIAVSPERQPGAKRIAEIQQSIAERKATCVFSEPQFKPRIVMVVLEGSSARHGVLDPLGAELSPGENQWFDLMQGLADNLIGCLLR